MRRRMEEIRRSKEEVMKRKIEKMEREKTNTYSPTKNNSSGIGRHKKTRTLTNLK